MLKIMFFKSPTCGMCSLFLPQIKSSIEGTDIELEIYDVSEDNDLGVATKYNVASAGVAVVLDSEQNEIHRWNKPCSATEVKKVLDSLM